MRYIDRTGCKKISDRGQDMEIKSLGALSRTATKIAEGNRLAVLKTSHGPFRIIKDSGLGAYGVFLYSLAEVDDFLKHLDEHEAERY